MLVSMKTGASELHIDAVNKKIKAMGFTPHVIGGAQRVAIGITGNSGKIDPAQFLVMPGVADAIPVTKSYKRVSRDFKPDDTLIDIGGHVIGGKTLALMAGPCSVESRESILEIAAMLADLGVPFLRGGAYKPRSSPYAFQGLKEEGLAYLDEARQKTGLKIVTEALSEDSLDLVAATADIVQIGARNMQNFALLAAAGHIQKPVLLKRGIAATIEELLMAAEYIAHHGNPNIILCERGIRTFETASRNTLDLNAVPILKRLSPLPVIVDPSHGIGLWDAVPAMALASVAAGADGLIIEVHNHPECALSDGYQSLKPKTFAALIKKLSALAVVMERTMPQA